MSESKAVDVNIMGREFTVSCTDDERPGLINAVNFLDKKMRDIRDSGKIIGVERIAIMTALNLSHELLNSKSGNVMSVISNVELHRCKMILIKHVNQINDNLFSITKQHYKIVRFKY